MVYISRISGLFGDWELRGTSHGLIGVTNRCSSEAVSENVVTRQGAEELQQYLAGQRTAFTVPLDLSGTPFQQTVWRTLQEIPFGTSVSYSRVAEMLGRPTAVRAVAQAIGKNPCLILIPCHRVVGKDGSLTGFSAGLALKKKLLQLEGIPYRPELPR